MTRLILFILALLLTASQGFCLTGEFLGSATVDSVSVTVGDIVTFDERSELSESLSSQIIDNAPAPGEQRTIQAREVIRRINSMVPAGTEIAWKGQSTVTVTRAFITISSQNISEAIKDYLQANSDRLPPAEIRFIPSSQPIPFLLPTGELTHEVIPSNPAIAGSSRFSIIFRVDGRVRKNMSVRGKLEMLAPIAVAAVPLQRGAIISPAQISMATHDISTMDAPCFDQSRIIGRKINRSVKAGAPVQLNNVVFPPTVKKGEVVKMVVKNGGLLLIATGIARADGQMNQTIRVQNINSRKLVYCRVSGPGVVEVAL